MSTDEAMVTYINISNARFYSILTIFVRDLGVVLTSLVHCVTCDFRSSRHAFRRRPSSEVEVPFRGPPSDSRTT